MGVASREGAAFPPSGGALVSIAMVRAGVANRRVEFVIDGIASANSGPTDDTIGQ